MPDQTDQPLPALLAALKAEQHALIDAAAASGGFPARSVVREIAELENTIAAVIALLDERAA